MDHHDFGARHWIIESPSVQRAAGFLGVVAASRLTIHRHGQPLPDGHDWSDVPKGAEQVGVLGRLVVAPEMRGQGIARLLLDVRANDATRSGCEFLLTLTSVHSRVPALLEYGFRSLRTSTSGLTGLPATVLLRELPV